MSSSIDLTDVTLVSEDATHNSLQMSSSRDLTDVSEARDLTDVSEDAAHNSLQMLSAGPVNKTGVIYRVIFLTAPPQICLDCPPP